MATIKISDLHSAGSELFMDSESYLNELTNEELNMAHGGSTQVCVTLITTSIISFTFSFVGTTTIRRPDLYL